MLEGEVPTFPFSSNCPPLYIFFIFLPLMVPWATLGYWGFPSFLYENSRGSWKNEGAGPQWQHSAGYPELCQLVRHFIHTRRFTIYRRR